MENGREPEDRQDANPPDMPPQITLDTAKSFKPLEVSESGLWRKSLTRIQERFHEASQGGKIACVLTQSIVPEWPKRHETPEPPEIFGMKSVGCYGGPSREPEQLFLRHEEGKPAEICKLGDLLQREWQLRILDNTHKLKLGNAIFEPMVAESALHDASGNAITYSDGQPVGIDAGCSRNLRIFIEDLQKPSLRDSYMGIARDAGKCLYGVPTHVSRFVWHDWQAGFWEIGSEQLWLNAIFEIAWRNVLGTPLTARKFTWNGSTRIPVDVVPGMSSRADNYSSSMARITNSSHWYSVIDDLFNASIVAIDLLFAIADDEIDNAGCQKVQDGCSSMNSCEFVSVRESASCRVV